MKLIDLLKLTDEFETHIVIYHMEDDNDAVFKGSISNVPYWLLDCVLDGKMITTTYTNEHDATFGAICVWVKEE